MAGDDPITMKSNGGSLVYYLKSTLKFLPLDAFYNEYSLANIISLFDLMRVPGIVITLDSRKDPGLNVIFDGRLHYFAPFKNGLYFFDTRVGPKNVSLFSYANSS